MNLSELIEYLQSIEDECGEYDVGATCDGWRPSEVAIQRNDYRREIILYGCSSVERNAKREWDEVTVVNKNPDSNENND